MLLSLPSVPYWVIEFGRNSSDIYQQHRVLSFSVAPNERIAVTDTGVLAYYTDAAVIDFVGLTQRTLHPIFLGGGVRITGTHRKRMGAMASVKHHYLQALVQS
jgi:hypothetical protein